MFLAGAAATTALDLVSSLTKTLNDATKANKAQGTFKLASVTTADSQGASASSASAGTIAPGTFNALLETQGQSGAQRPGGGYAAKMMSFLDGNGDGSVTQTELSDALGSNATDDQKAKLFAKLDGDSDGSVSKDELATALRNYRRAHHHSPMNPSAPVAASAASTGSTGAVSSTLSVSA